MNDPVNIKKIIADGYDRIANTIGREDVFYNRVLALHGEYAGNILDIACGTGPLFPKIRAVAPDARFYGIDISPRLCEMARKNNPDAEIVVGDAESMPFQDNYFDVVFMTETFAYIQDRPKALSEVWRVLKHGGVFIVTVPNRDWLQYDFYEKIRDKKRHPVEEHYFRFEEITNLLTASGFQIRAYRGSDNLYYYAPYHKYEQVLAFFLPFLHRKMKRLLFKCVKP
jgi:ubiquinone/menaquinone biosynthesis C-methylase UbiE